MCASDWVYKVLSAGYKILFVSEHKAFILAYDRSTYVHKELVDNTPRDLTRGALARQMSDQA